MAASVTPNLAEISTADTITGWSGNSGQQDTEVKVQGDASYTWQASKSSRTSCTFTPSTNLDMSASDTHIFFWMKCDVFPFAEAKTTGTTNTSGLTFRVTDGSGNYREWHIAGSDTWGGEWKCFVVDLANTSQLYAQSGTMSWNDIDVLTWYIDISNSGNIRIIDNCWNDICYYGTGLTVTGTDFDLTDVAAIDENSSYRYGVLQNIDGVIFCQGKLTIGSGATTTTLNSSNETLIFRDRNGDGEGMVSSTLYELVFAGSGNASDVSGLVVKGAGSTDTTRFGVDASDTDADVTIDGSTFIRAGTAGFASSSSVTNSVFNDCLQISPSTGVFRSNTISNYVGANGALLFPSDDTNISGLTFINCDNGVEYDSSSDSTDPEFDNFVFDDVGGNYDVNNTSGGSVSVSLVNTPSGKANSYNPGGDTVTFTSDPVTTLITVKDGVSMTVIEGARVLLEASDDLGPLHFEEPVSIVRSGSTATVTHTGHGLSTDDIVHIKGADQKEYNGVFTITYVDTNSYSYTVSGTPDTPATGSPTSTDVVISTTTNSSGQVSDSRVLSSDQNVVGKVRMGSSSPYYKTSPLTGTINSSSGWSTTALMLSDG